MGRHKRCITRDIAVYSCAPIAQERRIALACARRIGLGPA
jgi:hypothetical protein